jgi:hypothetical protein
MLSFLFLAESHLMIGIVVCEAARLLAMGALHCVHRCENLSTL